MREILFRGKRLDTDEWVEGNLWLYGKKARIAVDLGFPKGLSWLEVDPATVGQFTGLLADGKRIFEGDVVAIQHGTVFEMMGRVVFDDGAFQVVDPNDTYECLWYRPDEMEVLGSIHDNPELLEVTPDERVDRPEAETSHGR